MKLLTLLTTFIITLASSNVFARTFVCENWSDFRKKEQQGTMFVGEKDGDTFIIRDDIKEKRTLTPFGKVNQRVTYYTSVNKFNNTLIFGITLDASKFSIKENGEGNVENFDLGIVELSVSGLLSQTYCNWQ